MKNLIFVLLFSLMLILACDDDSGTSGTSGGDVDTNSTVQEDVQNIENTSDQVIASLINLTEGEFGSFMEEFLDVQNGDYRSTDWVEDMANGLDRVIDFDQITNNYRFSPSSNSGVYSWNSSIERWEETESSDDIELRFPSSQSSSENTMSLILSEYSDTPVIIDGDDVRLPTRLLITLQEDGEDVFRFDLQNVTYTQEGNDAPLPTNIDLEIFTAPITHNLRLIEESSTRFQLSFGMTDEDDSILDLNTTVNFANSDYLALEDEDVGNAEVTFLFEDNLRVELSADIGDLAALDDPTENQINQMIRAEVFFGSQKIGELEYDEDSEDIIIVYKDGSSESSERYYRDFLESLETVTFDFTGEWVDLD